MRLPLRPLALVLPSLLLPVATHAADKPAEADAKPKILVVPPAKSGDVRAIYEKRIAKALTDQLSASSRFEAVTDKDKAVPTGEKAEKGKPVQAKGSATSRKIDEADLLRQEGTDLAAEGKHGPALEKLRAAIALYEKSYLELVDYTKLADAYSRAGLAAFQMGAAKDEVVRLFEAGIAIQPTLVIDRRKQPKELLDLFDGTHERMDKAPKLAIEVAGAAPGAEVFIDGVRVGPLPATKDGLLPGTHYAQVRGEGLQPWGTVVRLKGKNAKVTAKLVAVKAAPVPVEEKLLTVEALADCSKSGTFHSPACKGPGQKLGKQTGANLLLFTLIKADRYGRLTLHPFAMDTALGATVAVKAVELAQDLGDLNQKVQGLEADLAASLVPFPKARALSKTPGAFSAK